MTYFEDLSVCDYFDDFTGKNVLAVGWLSKGHPYTKGEVSKEVFYKILDLLTDAWQPGGGFLGWHDCDLCNLPSSRNAVDDCRSVDNIFVPVKDKIYVSPEGILHYIRVHSYKPPDEYIRAVENCPKMKSPEYFESLLRIGGEEFKKVIEDDKEWFDD